MKFSSKAKYGMKVVCELAKYYESQNPISTSKLANLTNISESYLEKIMSVLKKNDIVVSKQGQNGGYVLNTNPKKLTIVKILTALEGSLYSSDCLDENCKAVGCPNKNVFNFIFLKINETLGQLTLQDILNKKV